jgi:pilus assembly protein CpaF
MSFEIILPFLRPIKAFLADDGIAEIMCNPDSSCWIERDGLISPVPEVRFGPGELHTGLEIIANKFGKQLDPDHPILNARLPDGSRLAAMVTPVVGPEPLLNIRKFSRRNFTLPELVGRKTLTEDMAERLKNAVRGERNLLISGATSSGKTTLLNALAAEIPDHERILVLEDTAEIRIAKPHVVSAECQTNTHKQEVTFDQLLKATLRHRPDRIILGEVRGAEARTLLDAMNTGHRGTLTTIHANSATGALRRLASLALRGLEQLRLADVEQEVHDAVELVIHMDRRDGRRSVVELLDLTAKQTSEVCVLAAEYIRPGCRPLHPGTNGDGPRCFPGSRRFPFPS